MKRKRSAEVAMREYVQARYDLMMAHARARREWLYRLAGIARSPAPPLDEPAWWRL